RRAPVTVTPSCTAALLAITWPRNRGDDVPVETTNRRSSLSSTCECQTPRASRDAEPLDDLREPLTADAELHGGTAPPSAGAGERGADIPPLEFGSRLIEAVDIARRRASDVCRKHRGREAPAPRRVNGEDGNHVLQLAHVPRPAIAGEACYHVFAQRRARADARSVVGPAALDQSRHFLA